MSTTISPVAAAEPGLRERKRQATSRAIQFAVLELSHEKGLENVTVDDISRRADISPRTFFNYFDSKESAVLGESHLTSLPDELVDEFLAAGPGASVLDGLRDIMLVVSVPDTEDFELHQLRKQVIHKSPHLLIQRISRMREFEVELTAIVEQRLAMDARAHAKGKEKPDQALIHDRASLTTQVALAAMRHSWGCWAESAESLSMPVLLANSFRELHTLI
ncbi:TetR/AcrR family transcriptional regulator [Subtercola lobariae]|uniref:TetR family transcriptional regulator n=1 Tax=Subtercola lobariae TaxID=1588641 RepID=A0A917AZY4_9MICO|nr:TetR/AcrR family transcriptional regulator [Subtercola lobariae]GGF13316.1 TetR family transcriptional regulator [Subtercola lobariae]